MLYAASVILSEISPPLIISPMRFPSSHMSDCNSQSLPFGLRLSIVGSYNICDILLNILVSADLRIAVHSICKLFCSMGGMMRVEIENIRSIKSISFEIPDGKVSLLTGPSGSGKSSIAAAIKGEIDQGDVRAGADPASKAIYIQPHEYKVKSFDSETEKTLYADELSSGVYDILMADDMDLETARLEFEQRIEKIRRHEKSLIARRNTIDELINSTRTRFNQNGDFRKTSMIGSAKCALENSPAERVELIKKHGGKYLTWLMDGSKMPQWHDKQICPFCLSDKVPQSRTNYLKTVTDTTETKGFDFIPSIEASLRSAGIEINDLYNIEEFSAIAQQVTDLVSERNAIEALLAFLNMPQTDLRTDSYLLDQIDQNNPVYKKYRGLPTAIKAAKGSSNRVKMTYGKMRAAFRQTVSKNQNKINGYLKRFDIPYTFIARDLNLTDKAAGYLLVHNDASSESIDYRNKLSYGEKNVIALILFLLQPVGEHDVIIIDDPVSSYDEYRREQIYKLVMEQELNNTVLLLSHDHVFAKYALYHYRKSKERQDLSRSLSSFDKRVLERTGDVLYLSNIRGEAKADKIELNDYDTMGNHVLNRLGNPNLSYYQRVINLRLFFECEKKDESDHLCYSYLSALLHARKTDNLAEYKSYLATKLADDSLFESDILKRIGKKTGLLLPAFSSVNEKDLKDTNGFLLIEKIAALREDETDKDLKAEMSDIIHMNAALVYCLNPYKFGSCSHRLLDAIN